MSTVAPNIVLLEPDKAFGSELADELSNAGFDVVMAGTASSAQQALCAQQALALVLETQFLGGKVVSFLDELISLHKLPSVVILLSDDPSFNASEAFRRGVDAVFIKPFSRTAFLELIKAASKPFLGAQLRRTTRIDTDFPVSLTKLGTASTLAGLVMNLSQGGAFVEVHGGSTPAVGDIFEFEITFPDGTPVGGIGRVSWIRLLQSGAQRFGFGLEFDRNSPEIERIFDAVNRLKTFSRG
jgi:CheY-like chemotaxis protein